MSKDHNDWYKIKIAGGFFVVQCLVKKQHKVLPNAKHVYVK